MGSPGAGKTTVGKMVAKAMKKTHIDVDNDLEKVWGMMVAQKVSISEVSKKLLCNNYQ